MKIRLLCVFLFASVFIANARADLKNKAGQFVSLLKHQKYEEAAATFDETMTRVMPPAKLQATWEQLTKAIGELQQISAVKEEKVKAFHMVVLTGKFEKASFDIKVVFDKRQRVTGLFFAPAAAVDYKIPPYVHKDKFTEREIVVDVGGWPLPASLTIPKGRGPFPALVLVHGSGPNDRDETIGPNKPFRDIAWGLASAGIVVLRYDKRTKVHGAKVMAEIATLTANEIVIDDAIAAAKLLTTIPIIDKNKVFLLGHSLGGMMAPRIAQRATFLAGIVIMAGLVRDLAETMLDQFTYIFSLDGKVSPEEQKKLDEVKTAVNKIKALTSKDKGSKEMLLIGCPNFWLDLRAYNPAEVAKSLELPILVLQGGRDYQVNMTDWKLWGKALHGKRNVRARKYGKLNHLFFEGTGPCSPSEYETHRNVEPYVIKDLFTWIMHRRLTPQ